MNGGAKIRPQVPAKPSKQFKLENFKFVKVLGKGSFGKVSLLVTCYFMLIKY